MRIFQICGGLNPSASLTVYKHTIIVSKKITLQIATDAVLKLRDEKIIKTKKDETYVASDAVSDAIATDDGFIISPIYAAVPISSLKPLGEMDEKQIRMNLKNLFKNLEEESGKYIVHFFIRVERFGDFLRSKNIESYYRGYYISTKEPDAPLPIFWEILAQLFPEDCQVVEEHQWMMYNSSDEGLFWERDEFKKEDFI